MNALDNFFSFINDKFLIWAWLFSPQRHTHYNRERQAPGGGRGGSQHGGYSQQERTERTNDREGANSAHGSRYRGVGPGGSPNFIHLLVCVYWSPNKRFQSSLVSIWFFIRHHLRYAKWPSCFRGCFYLVTLGILLLTLFFLFCGFFFLALISLMCAFLETSNLVNIRRLVDISNVVSISAGRGQQSKQEHRGQSSASGIGTVTSDPKSSASDRERNNTRVQQQYVEFGSFGSVPCGAGLGGQMSGGRTSQEQVFVSGPPGSSGLSSPSGERLQQPSSPHQR